MDGHIQNASKVNSYFYARVIATVFQSRSLVVHNVFYLVLLLELCVFVNTDNFTSGFGLSSNEFVV